MADEEKVQARLRLLQPEPPRIERYMLSFIRLPDLEDGSMRFVAEVGVMFRPERLLCAAGLPMSEWHKWLLKLFTWVKVPWCRQEEYDPLDAMSDEEADALTDDQLDALPEVAVRWRFYWYRPVVRAVEFSMWRAQRKALAGCVVRSIKVNGTELLVSPAPVEMFSSVAIGTQLVAPSVRTGGRICIETSRTEAPLQFSMIGAAATLSP
jgi:hypothetical protein